MELLNIDARQCSGISMRWGGHPCGDAAKRAQVIIHLQSGHGTANSLRGYVDPVDPHDLYLTCKAILNIRP